MNKLWIAPALLLAIGCGKAADKPAANAAPAAAAADKPAGDKPAEPAGDKPAEPAAAVAQGAADMGERGDAVKGKEVYERACMSCHQADGTGMGGTLGANFREDKTRLAKPDSALFKSIKEGMTGTIGTMPAGGTDGESIAEQDIKNVIAYIRKEFGS